MGVEKPFWPSSPSNGPLVDDKARGIYVLRWGNVQDPAFGDVHFYDYTSNCMDVSKFPKPRFASEYGFQSLPSFKTWQPVTLSSDWQRNSSLMDNRQHHPDGLQQLEAETGQHFDVPPAMQHADKHRFRQWIFLTQAMQAICLQSETEHYIRLRGDAMVGTAGALYWQLNDIWQAPTWASLEFSTESGLGAQNWKMSHYFARRFFQPQLISAEHTLSTGDINVIVSNDWTAPPLGTFNVSFVEWSSGATIKSWNGVWSVAESSASVLKFNLAAQQLDVARGFLAMEVSSFGVTTRNQLFLTSLSASATPTLPRAHVKITHVQATSSTTAVVSLSVSAVAPFVWLESELTGVFSDNAMVLLAGAHSVEFRSPRALPPNVSPAHFSVMSLSDAMQK